MTISNAGFWQKRGDRKMTNKSRNILTFVLVLFICTVFFVCLNAILGTYTTCDADGWVDPSMLDNFGDVLGGTSLNQDYFTSYPGSKRIGYNGTYPVGNSYLTPLQITPYAYNYNTYLATDISSMTFGDNFGYGGDSLTTMLNPMNNNSMNTFGISVGNLYPMDTGVGTFYGSGSYGTPIGSWEEFTLFSLKYGHYKILPSEFDFPVKPKYGMLYGGLYGIGFYGQGWYRH